MLAGGAGRSAPVSGNRRRRRYATLLARPSWLWARSTASTSTRGHRQREVYTTLDAQSAPAALIGMDLVRLGSSGRPRRRGTRGDHRAARPPRAGGRSGHVRRGLLLVVSRGPDRRLGARDIGRFLGGEPVEGNAAISNASPSATTGPSHRRRRTGADFDTWRDPAAPTGIADSRLQASCAVLGTSSAEELGARDLAATSVITGRPVGRTGSGDPGPPADGAAGRLDGDVGCMHLHDYMNTTSAMICELPQAGGGPLRTWVAPGNPCVSIFVPTFPASETVRRSPKCSPTSRSGDRWRRCARRWRRTRSAWRRARRARPARGAAVVDGR